MQKKILFYLLLLTIFVFFFYFSSLSPLKKSSLDNEPIIFHYISSYETSDGLLAYFRYNGSKLFYQNKLSSPIIENLTLNITFDASDELTIQILDSDNSRFELPKRLPYPYEKSEKKKSDEERLYRIELDEKTFGFRVIRNKNNITIFDCIGKTLIYSDKYLEISTSLSGKNLFGLGERRQDFKYRPNSNFTIWPKDQYAAIDNATGPDHQTYGHHPMYLLREEGKDFNIVLLRTVAAMDFEIGPDFEFLKYKIVGGVLEFKIFLGDNQPEPLLKKYHQYINGYTLMPFWSLGFHQSRWGYNSSAKLLEIVKKFDEYDIPLDTIWSDIDYLDRFRDFTFNKNFKSEEIFQILDQKRHWVPILDIGIHKDFESSAYQKGLLYDTYIKSTVTGEPLLNCVWPGIVSYPDFNHPNASKFWGEELVNLHEKIPFSGLWLDMNEPAAFETGEVLSDDYICNIPFIGGQGQQNNEIRRQLSKKEIIDNTNDLPYVPGKGPLDTKTASLNATHYQEGEFAESQKPISELDFHSLNGFSEAKISYDIMKEKLNMTQPFILSRSNIFGQGAYTSHWTGDNYAQWTFLQTSISEIFNFQLFGIPLTGVDLCGFGGNTTEELCARFMQAGALYPFSRNHNAIDAIDQEPWAFGDESPVLSASRESLKFRYSILKWYYSVFVRNDKVGAVFRPLFFDFPQDENLYVLDSQFLIGTEIMAAPILYPNQTSREVYFPGSVKWFDFIDCKKSYFSMQGKSFEIENPLFGLPPIFIREGSVIPLQNITKVSKTADLNNEFMLKIIFSQKGPHLIARGTLLTLSDYNNENNVVDNCTNGKKCILNIIVKGKIVENNKIPIEIDFLADNLQENFIIGFEIGGIMINGTQRVYRRALIDKIKITKGEKIKLEVDEKGELNLLQYSAN